MTEKEKEDVGWDTCRTVTALVLDDGTVLFASCDEEGNRPGELFGYDPNGRGFTVFQYRGQEILAHVW